MISEQSLERGLQPALLEGTCPPILHADSRVAQARRTPAPRLPSWPGSTGDTGVNSVEKSGNDRFKWKLQPKEISNVFFPNAQLIC